MPPQPLRATTVRSVRLATARFRRPLLAGCVAAAVASGLQMLAPSPPPTDRVLVAGRDLPAGTTVGPADLTEASWPVGAVPDGALTADQLGARAVLAVPMRRGEPLTDVRLVGDALLDGQSPGTRAVTVRPADPAMASLLRAGDRVDVVAAGAPTDGSAPAVPGDTPADTPIDTPGISAGSVLAENALVLSTVAAGSGAGEASGPLAWTGDPGPSGEVGAVLLALPGETAHRVAALAAVSSLGVALRSRI